MKTEFVDINDQDLAAIREAYRSFKTFESKLLPTKVDSGDFTVFNIYTAELLNEIDSFTMMWGNEQANFNRLGLVFETYLKSYPHQLAEAFGMFRMIIELLAKIMEHKDIVNRLALYHNFIKHEIDSFNSKGAENRDVLFKELDTE